MPGVHVSICKAVTESNHLLPARNRDTAFAQFCLVSRWKGSEIGLQGTSTMIASALQSTNSALTKVLPNDSLISLLVNGLAENDVIPESDRYCQLQFSFRL